MDYTLEEQILSGRIIPPPKSLKVKSEKLYTLKDGAKVEILSKEEGLAELVTRLIFDFWKVEAKVTQKGECKDDIATEGYKIRINSQKLTIEVATKSGIFYALQTLRHLAESERGVATSKGVFIFPSVEIIDEPDLAFRGMHICIFPRPDTTYREVETQIRLAAALKYNYVVIESWGTIRYPSHPEFCWPDRAFSTGEIRKLVQVAKSLGVTPIPQLNIFGHASQSRSGTGKHALLNLHPEFAPLFEPDGWCWCLSNPNTQTFLGDIVKDLIDIYDTPPFFHLGCDEADNAGTCIECRRSNYSQIFERHLLYFHKILKEHNIRPMLWHDMFVMHGDKRFDGYVANGTKDTIEILERLPRDFIICDWRYNFDDNDRRTQKPTFATMRHFVEKGFDTIGCPWYEVPNTLAFGKALREVKAFGLLETIWHYRRGLFLFMEYFYGAWAAWNGDSEAPNAKHTNANCSFMAAMRNVHADMGITNYEEFGSSAYQTTGPLPLN